jgi:hypothetical protein
MTAMVNIRALGVPIVSAVERIAALEERNRELAEELAEVKQAADLDRVMLFPEWCSLNKFSASTGQRILRSGAGPELTRLSPRRFGISVRNHLRWQRARTARAADPTNLAGYHE